MKAPTLLHPSGLSTFTITLPAGFPLGTRDGDLAVAHDLKWVFSAANKTESAKLNPLPEMITD